jgi:hypothetical protein
LLGQRYGSIPRSIPPDLVEREPWLKEHLDGKKSVTELEILHGVLNNPAMADRAFFFFRDPAYVNSFPPEKRPDFLSQDDESNAKLRDLKDRTRQCHRAERLKNPLWENREAIHS